MKTRIKDIFFAAREISKGSGAINLLSISGITFIIYIVLLILNKSDLFYILTNIKNRNNYETVGDYNGALEYLYIDEANVIIPIITVIISFIPLFRIIKSNPQNRLLPISPWTKIIAVTFVIYAVTLVSSFVVYLLDQGVVYYIRHLFLLELTDLRESSGYLYRQIPTDRILANNYQYPLSLFKNVTILGVLAPLSIILLLNLNLIFRQYSIIKGPALICLVILIGVMLQNIMQPIPSTVMSAGRIPGIYFSVMLINLIFTLYYLLKEREE
jgi:hypothetical protein